MQTTLTPNAIPSTPARPAAGLPTAFSGCAGLYHPAAGATAVLMAGSWGYEALCLAAARRRLAETLAAAGYPTLRYDHPGTGDSLDAPAPDLSAWRAALVAAARRLAALSGAERLVVIADGIGAAVALSAIGDLPATAGMVLLAPALSGRAHLREVQALAGMVGGGGQGAASIAGIRLPDGVAADLAGLDLRATDFRIPRALVAARPGRGAEAALAERIATDTGRADAIAFDDYEAAVSDPTRAVPPRATFAAVVDWLARAVPAGHGRPHAAADGGATLAGDGFREEGMRFGEGGRLYGVLATPPGPAAGPAVILANAGRDPHTGWARFGVDLTRRLARAGFPALRMDLSGIGESPEPPGWTGGELLYSDRHAADLRDAAAALAGRGFGAVVLAGRCSGAYAALHAAPDIPGVRAVAAINLLRVVWDPREDVAAAVTADIRPIGAVARQALDPRVLGRILRGEVDPRNLVRRLAGKVADAVAARGPAAAARRRQAAALVRGLGARGVRVAFVSGADDVGLGHIGAAFGSLDALRAIPGASLTLVEGTDHNLTPVTAREFVGDVLIDLLTELSR